jgi:hypothetical protein
LSPEVAAELGRFNGDKLDLNGLTSLELDSAQHLSGANCQSGLYLNGLTTVTPEVVEVLANGNSHLSLQGLTTLDNPTRQALKASQTKLAAVRKLLMLPASANPH